MSVEGVGAILAMLSVVCLVIATIILPFALIDLMGITKNLRRISRSLENIEKKETFK